MRIIIRTLTTLCLLALLGCTTTSLKDSAQLDSGEIVVGHWRSVQFEGSDIASSIKEITFTFNGDSTFICQASMTSGNTVIKEGVYRVQEGSILFSIKDAPAAWTTFKFKDSFLIINDFEQASRVWLRRVSRSFLFFGEEDLSS
jgi:hypothetical protein